MKILVAIDGSKYALRAVKYAAGLVAQLRKPSSVTLVSVHDDTGLRHAKALVGSEQVADYLRELSDNESSIARLPASSIWSCWAARGEAPLPTCWWARWHSACWRSRSSRSCS